MSLDVYLDGPKHTEHGSGIFVRRNGQTLEISREEWDRSFPGTEPVIFDGGDSSFYHANITHNLGKMADAAGIYRHLWRPEELGIEIAWQLIEPLSEGLARLRAHPEQFLPLNPENGWGNYDGLVSFVENYLDACRRAPTASVRVWR